MTPFEFLSGWGLLLVLFVLIISRIPRVRDHECPPHVWERAGMGDHPDTEFYCLRCPAELRSAPK